MRILSVRTRHRRSGGAVVGVAAAVLGLHASDVLTRLLEGEWTNEAGDSQGVVQEDDRCFFDEAMCTTCTTACCVIK